jgi:hypothetical protein
VVKLDYANPVSAASEAPRAPAPGPSGGGG